MELLTHALAESENESDLADFAATALRITRVAADAFNYACLLLRGRRLLTTRQLRRLRRRRRHRGGRADPCADISVRFLGADWAAVDSALSDLTLAVEDVIGGGGDFLAAASMVRRLNRVQEDLGAHADAVFHGRLNKQRNDRIR